MAISNPVARGNTTYAETGGASLTRVSDTFTPAADALLVAIVHISTQDASPAFAVTDTFGGTSTWRLRAEETSAGLEGGGYTHWHQIYVAIAGSSPSSGAITMTWSSLLNNSVVAASFFTVDSGFDPDVAAATPVGETGTGASTSTSCVATWTGTPDTTSLVIGGVLNWGGNAAVTQPTSWTSANPVTWTGWDAQGIEGYRNTGGNQASVTWTAASSGSSTHAVMLEIPDAGAPAGTATPARISVAVALPQATATGNTPYVVASVGSTLTTSASPSVTFSGWTPAVDDVVVLFVSSTAILAIQTSGSMPSGWVNPLGSGVEINSDAHGMCCAYHLVTSGEASAVTLTYTATSLLTTALTGYTHGVVVRQVDSTNVVDGFATAFDSGNVTPHVLAGITGSGVLLDASLVVASVAKDTTGAYGSVPTGWAQVLATNTNQGRWTGTRDTLTVVNTNVTAVNITPSGADEYVSISLAFAKVASAGGTAAPAAISAPSALPAPTPQAGTVTSPAAISAPFTLPAPVPEAGGDRSPAVIATAAVLPAATPRAGTVTSPAVLPVAVALPAAVVTGGGSAIAAPGAIVTAAVLPAATPRAGTVTAPAVLSVAVVLPAATPQTGVSGTAAPAVISTAALLPAATPLAGTVVSPAVIARAFALPAAIPQASKVVTPAVIVTSFVPRTVTPFGGGGGIATPDRIVVLVTLPAVHIPGTALYLDITLTALSPVFARPPELAAEFADRAATSPELVARAAGAPATTARAAGDPEFVEREPDDPTFAHDAGDPEFESRIPGEPTI